MQIVGIAWRDCFARRGNVISIAFAARLSSLRVTHSWHLVNVNTLFRQEVIRLSKGKSASAFQATLPREVIRIDPETTTLELDFSHAFEVPPKTHLRQPSNEVCARTKRLRLRFAYSTYDRYMAQLHIGGTREADLLDIFVGKFPHLKEIEVVGVQETDLNHLQRVADGKVRGRRRWHRRGDVREVVYICLGPRDDREV
jgi:hypothetical protein